MATTFLVFSGAVGYLAVALRVYESRAVVQVGLVGGTQQDSPIYIEPIENVIWRLNNDYAHADASLQTPRLIRVVKDNKAPNNITELVAEARSANQARQFLERVTKTLLAEHAQIQQLVL